MLTYFSNRAAAAQYVADLTESSKADCALTMTIVLEKSGDCSVLTAIDVLSDATETREFLKELVNIYEQEELDGSSHQENVNGRNANE